MSKEKDMTRAARKLLRHGIIMAAGVALVVYGVFAIARAL
jgi:hypothetical protein